MLPRRLDTTTVLPVSRTEPLAPAETGQQALRRSLSALLGRQVQAEVLSLLTDGSYLVRVAGTPLRMALPHGSATGARLPMTLASLDPRPTFELRASGALVAAEPWTGHHEPHVPPASARSAASAYAAGTLAARTQDILAATTAPGQGTPAEPAHSLDLPTLSAGGRIITTVLGAAQASGKPEASIVAPAPLLPHALPEPVQLARQLQQAIAHSGLFYESHLAEWVAGTRTSQELGREPQAARQPSMPSTDPASARMVDQQLAAHEHGRLSWQGQPWPGLAMQWDIRREEPGERDADGRRGEREDAGEAAWRSDVRFMFAALGEVGASIVLEGGHAHIRIHAADGAACEQLRSHAHRLEAALGAAGVPLAALGVTWRDGAGDDDA